MLWRDANVVVLDPIDTAAVFPDATNANLSGPVGLAVLDDVINQIGKNLIDQLQIFEAVRQCL